MRLRNIIIDLLFPPRCPVCHAVVVPRQVFCPACREEIIRERTPRFTHGQTVAFSACVSGANYGEKTRSAILRLKRIPDSYEAAVFADMICDELTRQMPDRRFDAVVAVPMSSAKLRRRFNQADMLAKNLAKRLEIPYLRDILVQSDDAAVQHSLGREARLRNAEKAYHAADGASVSGSILLVDDVMTTGATLDRCAQLLRNMGAADVVAATAVSVPPEHENHETTNDNSKERDDNAV